MNLRTLGIVLTAVIASLALAVSSASARELFEASSSAWYLGPSPGTKLAETKVLITKPDPETKVTIATTISTFSVKLTATGLKCVSCKVENSGGLALAKGELELTGMTLSSSEPAKCSTTSTLKTKAFTATMGSVGVTGRMPIRFAPTAGETFAVVEITGAGCPIAGAYKMTGFLFGEGSNTTEKFSKEQTFSFSQAIQEELGSATSLKVAGNSCFFTAVLSKSLEPSTEFAVKSK